MQFETVIGLEVHVQLSTKTKIFCGCSTKFGSEPNSNVCPVCIGLPGALAVLNKSAVDKAIAAGLALNCTINKHSAFDRKSYFYPDLGKAYQTSQMFHPICTGGHLDVELENGTTKRVNLTRIHLEEDAGKLVHGENVGDADCSYVDLNRSSIGLIEIVSDPDMRSAEEARMYMQKIRNILHFADISNCNMEEGSLRCDANVSIRPVGQKEFGTRVEIKNMNSFRNVQRAVEYEVKRQEEAICGGEKIIQETRLWDNNRNVTVHMRNKEDADDYRYFPCPDVRPLVITDADIESVRASMPELPDAVKAKFTNKYGLTVQTATLLSSEPTYANFFNETVAKEPDMNISKAAANWISSELLRVVNDKNCGIYEVGIKPADILDLVKLIDKGTISGKQGKEVFHEAVQLGKSPVALVNEKGLAQESDTGALETIIKKVMAANPAEVERYKAGESAKLQGFFVGQIMKESGGKANPKLLSELLKKLMS